MAPLASSKRADVLASRSASQSMSRSQLESRTMRLRGTSSLWALMVLAVAGATSSYAQQRTLNPTVAVREHPSSTVPTECEQGLEAAVPRAPQPPPAPLPETSSQIANQDVAQALRRVQAAAEADDRDRFVAALAEARAAADAAPPGGQREAAREALRVDDDIDRLWSFAVTSPTGAFFDASSEGGALLTMMRQYPDFGRNILDSTLVVDGQTLYPTRESRRFLVQQAASRLLRLGIHSAPRAPRPPATVRTRPSEIETADTPPAQVPVMPRPASRDRNVPPATSAATRRETSTRSGVVAAHAGGASSKRSPTGTKRSAAVTAPKHAHSAEVRSAAAPIVAKSSATQKSVTTPPLQSRSTPVPSADRAATHEASSSSAASSSAAKNVPTSSTTAGTGVPAVPVATTRGAAPVATTAPGNQAIVTANSNGGSSTPLSSTTPTQPAMTPAAGNVSSANPPIAGTVPTTAATSSSTASTAMAGNASTGTTGSAGSFSVPPSTETTSSTTSTTTGADASASRGGKLNLIFAFILIVAGIGLLVVFLRASD